MPDASKFTICGDIHGQFYDLMNIFKINGLPSPTNPYLFNGDFVDRGSFSVECIFTLFGFKLLYPNHFFLSRGNHESYNMNQMYGFHGEVVAKYTVSFRFFRAFPFQSKILILFSFFFNRTQCPQCSHKYTIGCHSAIVLTSAFWLCTADYLLKITLR